jgi:hypothetical protein
MKWIVLNLIFLVSCSNVDNSTDTKNNTQHSESIIPNEIRYIDIYCTFFNENKIYFSSHVFLSDILTEEMLLARTENKYHLDLLQKAFQRELEFDSKLNFEIDHRLVFKFVDKSNKETLFSMIGRNKIAHLANGDIYKVTPQFLIEIERILSIDIEC